MLKTFLIGLKDLRIAFRDRAALMLMLAAPFALTLGLGLVTGRFSGAGSGIADIPVIVVNQDHAQLGNALAGVFTSQDLAELLEPTTSPDAAAARKLVDEDKAAAAVTIPEGFTRATIPQQADFASPGAVETNSVKIEVYANPTRPTSAGIIQTIVDEFLTRVEEGRTTAMTGILQMLSSGRLTPQEAQAAGIAVEQRLESSPPEAALGIRLHSSMAGGGAVDFDPLAYIAPGMALMFLMYTVSHGGRSILVERQQGSLPRLLVTPTRPAQILGGKVFGIFLAGAAQMFILVGGCSLLFGLKWGDPTGVIVLVLAAVFAASGWGMLITALAPTPGQVASIGSALMLIFGILGGSFIDLEGMPPFVRALSSITPNAWALDGFKTLALGDTLADMIVPVLALLVMGVALFVLSTLLFGKKNLADK